MISRVWEAALNGVLLLAPSAAELRFEDDQVFEVDVLASVGHDHALSLVSRCLRMRCPKSDRESMRCVEVVIGALAA
jgi:hypothetical protein